MKTGRLGLFMTVVAAICLTIAASSGAPAHADARGYEICGVPPTEQVLFTWRNQRGYWLACGPVQCIQVGNRTEEKAMDYVWNEVTGADGRVAGPPRAVCGLPARRGGKRIEVRFYRLFAQQWNYDDDPRRFILTE